MKRRTKALALSGVLAALAVALLFLGGVIPLAALALPVLASLTLLPVYIECGTKWGFLWYASVVILGILLAPEKEAAILFVFFGYYPILRRYFGRIRAAVLRWCVKLIYLNTAVAAAYGLMIFVFRIGTVADDFAAAEQWVFLALAVLANVCFAIYDLLLARLEVFYHVRIRPKLKL